MLLGGMAVGFARGFVRRLPISPPIRQRRVTIHPSSPSLDRLPPWPSYTVTALTFFLLVAVVTGVLHLVAQNLLTTSQRQNSTSSAIAGFAIGALTTLAHISITSPWCCRGRLLGTAEGAATSSCKRSTRRTWHSIASPMVLS